LSKRTSPKLSGPIVAALDPLHANAKPAALDAVILKNALELAGGQPAKVVAFHTYVLPAPPVSVGAIDVFAIGMSADEIKMYQSRVRGELDHLADDYGIPARNRLLAFGDASVTLPETAKKQRASVVVMGAVSRSALKRIFIGHTAERTLDALECDVFIVKLKGFKTSVAPRRHPVFDLPAL
jgi:universal stress protein E